MKASSSLPKRKGIPLSGSSVKPFTIVAIGASAGGLEAITQLLQNLSSDTGMAYIYVQHLSPDHKSMLTELLSKKTGMKVHEVENMEQMKPNRVYVIPYDKEIEVTNGHIRLIPRPKNKPTNLSIDVLFSSLALTHGANVIGIILSGNGSDGTRGLKEIKLAGGITFAQDDSAKSTSMPRSAVAEGVVDFVLSPKEMAKEIMLLSKHSGNSGKPVKTSAEEGIHMDDPDLKGILQQLHKRKNVDFSYYKLNTIRRRIWRRMLIQKAGTVKQYAALIAKKNNELDLLYRDLLINVTDFFRDPDAFMVLKKTVLPRLLNGKPAGETLRLWVAACATGEEVYSLAILLIELQDSKTNNIPFQIFASDLSAEAIRDARKGEYTAQQLSGMSPKRLQRFFTKVKDKYRVSQHLRDVCIFAQHNILSDPPFSRMDFISCRNFLIYLEQAAQKKAITTFHYALREGGCL
ncbi:MAG TPA: chemotaxis protein CheB, partial [Bacteroidia bacterium]|nr:chemotaxis protein CheB [Bacteroidia bacterium]